MAAGALTYLVIALLTLEVPRWIFGQLTTKKELGLHKTMTWRDLAIAPAGMIVYFVLTVVILSIVTSIFPDLIKLDQVQNTGVVAPQRGVEMAVVLLLFVVVGPFIEELLFRGYLYGKLRRNGVNFWLTMVVVSVLFGAAHMQWNVALDTFSLSLVMCITREITGTIWVSILMHMIKNGIASYFLFINPNALGPLS